MRRGWSCADSPAQFPRESCGQTRQLCPHSSGAKPRRALFFCARLLQVSTVRALRRQHCRHELEPGRSLDCSFELPSPQPLSFRNAAAMNSGSHSAQFYSLHRGRTFRRRWRWPPQASTRGESILPSAKICAKPCMVAARRTLHEPPSYTAPAGRWHSSAEANLRRRHYDRARPVRMKPRQ